MSNREENQFLEGEHLGWNLQSFHWQHSEI